MGRFILFLLAMLAFALGRAGARGRHLGRRPLGGARRRHRVRRGRRGGRLRPWQRLRGRAEPDRHQRPCRRPGAAERQGHVAVGVVPSRGRQAYRARIIAVDPARDLALLEVEEGTLPPIPLYVGPLDDGAPIAALGYPGNVDLATARSADDYIQPLPPTRSVGIFSNVRPINGITTLLHTANIARGHSRRAAARPVRPGARRQHADHPQPGRRRALRLRRRQPRAHRLPRARRASPSSRSPPNASRWPTGCARTRSAPPPRSAPAEAAAAAARPRRARRASAALARDPGDAARTGSRSPSCCSSCRCSPSAAAASCWLKNRPKPAMILGGVGAGLLLARDRRLPRPAEPRRRRGGAGQGERAPRPRAGPLRRAAMSAGWCRSAAGSPISPTDDVPLDWTATGCVNGRTQYAQNGEIWTPDPGARRRAGGVGARVPARRPANMSSPAICSTRRRWTRVRGAAPRRRRQGLHRRPRGAHRSSPTSSARSAAMLPRLPNERLVYACENQRGGAAAGRRLSRLASCEPRAYACRGSVGRISMIRKLLIALRAAAASPTAAQAEWHEATSTNFIVYSEGSAAGRARLRGQARALPLCAAPLPQCQREPASAEPAARLPAVERRRGPADGRAAAASPAITSPTRAA